MRTQYFKLNLLMISLLLPAVSFADNSPPQVITPQATPAPQTPASPTPPPGTTAPAIGVIPEKVAPGAIHAQPKAAPPKG